MPPVEYTVDCPKCGARAGEPCRSIRHGRFLEAQVYVCHKKRRRAVYMVARVLSPKAVPVRPTASRPRVGPVDSAVKGLVPS